MYEYVLIIIKYLSLKHKNESIYLRAFDKYSKGKTYYNIHIIWKF